MKPTLRRAIGLFTTLIYLIVYILVATGIGVTLKQTPNAINLLIFLFLGIVWVFPLYPLFKWMRPKAHEIVPKEAPPKVSNLR